MMAWALICVCILAVLVPAEGQTTQWQDGSLRGQMFSVMSGGEVRFRSDSNTTLSNITGLTVCMRVLFEEDKYNLQLSFRNSTYGVSYTATGDYSLYLQSVNGGTVSFRKFSMTPSSEQLWPWRNRCFTWESSTGMAQLWFDGKMSIRKGVARGQVFSGEVELSLSSFVGQVTDVYVWDSALRLTDLSGFLGYSYYPSGSILNWRQIQYSTRGYAVLEPTSVTALSPKLTRRRKQKRERGQSLRRQ